MEFSGRGLFLAQNPGSGLYHNSEQQETECLRKKSDTTERAINFSKKKKKKNRERERERERELPEEKVGQHLIQEEE
jgi:hypothetical protein